MTETEWTFGWSIFRGTFRLYPDDMPAYMSQVEPLDGPAWRRVANWYAANCPAGSQVPSPSDVRDLVVREAANATFATDSRDCPYCDHGQVMVWRVDWQGFRPSYFPHTASPDDVVAYMPGGCVGFRVARTTVSCDCNRGRALRVSAETAHKPVLASYTDRVATGPMANRSIPWTCQFAIEEAIRSAIVEQQATRFVDA